MVKNYPNGLSFYANPPYLEFGNNSIKKDPLVQTPNFNSAAAIPLGVFWNETWQNNNLNNYTTVNNNGSTMAISGGMLRLTQEPGTGGFTRYIRLDALGSLMLENIVQTITFKQIAPRNATSYGISGGDISTDAFETVDSQSFFEGDTGNDGFVGLYNDGVNIGFSALRASNTLGDTLRLTITRNGFTNTSVGVDVTTPSNTATYSHTYNLSTTLMPTAYKPAIYLSGGTWDIVSWTISSPDYQFPDWVFMGDSRMEGYTASAYALSMIKLLMAGSTQKYTMYAAQGSVTQDWIDSLPFLTNTVKGKNILIMGGGNDKLRSVSQTVTFNNMLYIDNTLTAAGYKVWWVVEPPRNDINVVPYNIFKVGSFPGRTIDLFTPFFSGAPFPNQVVSTYYNADNIHLNDAGQARAKNFIQLQMPYSFQ